MAGLFDSESGEMMSHDVDKTIGHFELFFDTDIKKIVIYFERKQKKKLFPRYFFGIL